MITWHLSDTEQSSAIIAHHFSDGTLPAGSDDRAVPQFSVCEKWNKCIAMCRGDGFDVPCDALVRATDEHLLVTFQHPENLVEQAGPELREELDRLGECPTGDVRITNSFQIEFSRRLIHAVPPLYAPNFHTASLSALHSVYKNILNNAIESHIRSIVIPPMFIVPGDFPAEAACHLVLRTFRRYFENFGPEPFVDLIVLTCPNDDFLMLYQKVLPVYFPRTEEEQLLSLPSVIPMDDGFGGTLMKERVLSIKVLVPNSNQDAEFEGETAESDCRSNTQDLTGTAPPPSDYWRVQKIRTGQRALGPKQQTPPPSPKAPMPRSSSAVAFTPTSPLAERALKADLSAIVSAGFLQVIGTDREGRHLILLTARELDLQKFDINQVLLYFVRVLDPIIARSSYNYVLVYCHTQAGDRAMSTEQAGALVKALTNNDARYVEKLAAIYVLHVGWQARIAMTYARMAILPREVSDRLVVLNCCRTLAELLLPITPTVGTGTSNGIDALLPDYVVDYDNLDHQDHRG